MKQLISQKLCKVYLKKNRKQFFCQRLVRNAFATQDGYKLHRAEVRLATEYLHLKMRYKPNQVKLVTASWFLFSVYSWRKKCVTSDSLVWIDLSAGGRGAGSSSGKSAQ